jgi:protein-L-isoaspartate(D-aspartate) O-methyltransferase
MDDTNSSDTAQALRESMISELRAMGAIHTDRVAEVFRAVPRHLFTPGADWEEVYNPTAAVHVKRDEDGTPISTVSAAQLQATMLEQAALRPGMNALEIGSGGVNAAMMSWLVGPEGTVTTVDIDPDVTDRASRLLDAAGYSRVNVVLADAENGFSDYQPYDRIIVTVGAWDIPPAWVEQLAPGGRLVVPLRIRGLTRSLALDHEEDHFVSRSAEVCGFVKIQGEGANTGFLLPLCGKEIGLRFDDGWSGDPHSLDGVLDTPRTEMWSGVTIGGKESFETLQLWLATVFPGFCRLTAPNQTSVLADPGHQWYDLTAIEDDSFAYLTTRRAAPGTSEFGTHAFGPHGSKAAEAMVEQIRVWDRHLREGAGPEISVWPKETPDDRLPKGLIIDKRHSRISISWPTTTE